MDGLGFTETVERLAEKVGVQLRYEEGAAPRRSSGGPQRPRLVEAHKLAAECYAEQLATPEALTARQFLDSRGFDADAAATLRRRLLAARGRGPAQAPAAEGLHRRGAGHQRPDRTGQPRPLRPVPRPADVADPRQQRRRDRLRRAPDLRRRPDRGEVPQHPRDADLQEEPGALRHRPGPPRDRARQPGGDRRGLHRRDGLPPRRREDRGRHLRHGLRRRPRAGDPPAAAGPRRVPRRGDLHLRRRRGRAEGRAARVRGRPELRRPDLRRRRADRAGPLRPAAAAG